MTPTDSGLSLLPLDQLVVECSGNDQADRAVKHHYHRHYFDGMPRLIQRCLPTLKEWPDFSIGPLGPDRAISELKRPRPLH